VKGVKLLLLAYFFIAHPIYSSMKRIWNLIKAVDSWVENQLYGMYPTLTAHMKKDDKVKGK
jgi:hypothetical protein